MAPIDVDPMQRIADAVFQDRGQQDFFGAGRL